MRYGELQLRKIDLISRLLPLNALYETFLWEKKCSFRVAIVRQRKIRALTLFELTTFNYHLSALTTGSGKLVVCEALQSSNFHAAKASCVENVKHFLTRAIQPVAIISWFTSTTKWSHGILAVCVSMAAAIVGIALVDIYGLKLLK